MELKSLRVRNYRCISDSGWVPIDEVACLVGRNESGKTGFMRAIERLNPEQPVDGYSPYEDYPREDWPAYNERHDDDPDIVASGRFHLEDADVAAVETEHGEGVLAGREVTIHRDYDNELRWELDVAESADGVTADEIGEAVLENRLPSFRYIGEYSVMEGTIDIEALLERRENDELTPSDRVFFSLLSVAGIELESFRAVDDWREKTAELEAASASVTADAMRYWNQSGDIRIRIRATTAETGDGERRLLDARIENRDHDVTVEFEQRSHGFRRFFSTFCQLSALKDREDDIVVMLDEPGLNLHARAKQEFLGFLKEELASENPLVYTTHSPFMIDPENIHRTNMVRANPVGATNVFTDIGLADEYTRFPLRNVFELDLMETLLVKPQTLLVETKADHIYLSVVSKLLQDRGESGLDPRWTVVPIRNAENIGSFLTLFGEEELDVAALLNENVSAERNAELDDGLPIRSVSKYVDTPEPTIEDVLSESFYLEIVNRAYATEIGETDGVPDRITSQELASTAPGESVVARLETYFEAHGIGAFDREVVALSLQRNRAELAEELDKESRRRFTRLFTDLENTLQSFEGIESQGSSLLDALRLR